MIIAASISESIKEILANNLTIKCSFENQINYQYNIITCQQLIFKKMMLWYNFFDKIKAYIIRILIWNCQAVSLFLNFY